MTKRWKKSEENSLYLGAGVYGVNWFKARSGDRSKDAVYAKARRLLGAGGLTRGSYSLKEACELTGYSRTHFLRARDALAQKWKRTSRTGSYLIYDDQLEDMVTWLGHDYWSKKHRLYGCLWCTTSATAHKAQGLCVLCWDQYRKRLARYGYPTKTKELLCYILLLCVDDQDIIEQLKRGRALSQKQLQKLGVGRER